MTLPALPPGPPRLEPLRIALADAATAFDEIARALPSVNDPDLNLRAHAVLVTGRAVLLAHGTNPGPDIATLVDGLIRGLAALDIPTRDPDLDAVTQSLLRLQQAMGLAQYRLLRAQTAATALGWQPASAILPVPLGGEIARDEAPHALARIAQGLDAVARRLDRLQEAADAARNAQPAPPPQQHGLVNVYVGEMRVQIDIARMQLTVGERTVDFAALWRAGEAIADLTEGFIASIRSLAARLAPSVRHAASRVAASTRGFIRYVATTARSVSNRRTAASPQEDSAPPPDFSHEEVKRRILANETIPDSWRPFVRTLDFSVDWRPFRRDHETPRETLERLWETTNEEILRDTFILTQFPNLEELSVSGCPIYNFPLVSVLRKLKKIDLSYSRFESLEDFRFSSNLIHISLGATTIHDLTPISYLSNIEVIDAGATRIRDISSLSSLPKLHTLNIMSTFVTNISVVNEFPSLKVIYIINTPIPNNHGIDSSRNIQIVGNDGMRRPWQPLRGPIPPGQSPPLS